MESKAIGCILRETDHYQCVVDKKGVRIITKDARSYPRYKTVSWQTWDILKHMNDTSLNGSCCLELGIGTYAK